MKGMRREIIATWRPRSKDRPDDWRLVLPGGYALGTVEEVSPGSWCAMCHPLGVSRFALSAKEGRDWVDECLRARPI